MSLPDGTEQRQHQRLRTVREGTLRIEGAPSDIGCIVLDLSLGGARLHLHNAWESFERCQLYIETEDVRHTCEVVWRDGSEVGVRFVI